MQKLVQKHTREVLNIVRDHKQINDVITLNKKVGNSVDPSIIDMNLNTEKGAYYHRLRNGIIKFRVDETEIKGGLTDGLLSTNWDDISTPPTHREKQGIEKTEEKSKQRTSPRGGIENSQLTGGAFKLPNKQIATKLLPEGNAGMYSNYERVTIEHLKKQVMILEAKCKVK